MEKIKKIINFIKRNIKMENKKFKTKFYFQWLKGDNCGLVEELDYIDTDDGEEFLHFVSGNICNKRFIAKLNSKPTQVSEPNILMAMIETPFKKWNIERKITGQVTPPTMKGGKDNNEVFTAPLLNKRKEYYQYKSPVESDYNKVIDININSFKSYDEINSLIDTNQIETKENISNVNNIVNTIEDPAIIPIDINDLKVIEPEKIITKKSKNPLFDVLENTKKEMTNISINIDMNIIPKAIYDVMKDNYPNGEELIMEYMIEYFQKELHSLQKEYYKEIIKDIYK